MWHEVAHVLAAQPPGSVLRVPKHQVEHPSAAGLSTSIGLPLGQRADFRFQYSDSTGLHVRDFGPHYEGRLDRIHPNWEFLAQCRGEARGSHVAALAALGALAGTLLGRKPEAVLAGAAIGGLLAMLTAGPALEGRVSNGSTLPFPDVSR
jgi:hypothetical protein